MEEVQSVLITVVISQLDLMNSKFISVFIYPDNMLPIISKFMFTLGFTGRFCTSFLQIACSALLLLLCFKGISEHGPESLRESEKV